MEASIIQSIFTLLFFRITCVCMCGYIMRCQYKLSLKLLCNLHCIAIKFTTKLKRNRYLIDFTFRFKLQYVKANFKNKLIVSKYFAIPCVVFEAILLLSSPDNNNIDNNKCLEILIAFNRNRSIFPKVNSFHLLVIAWISLFTFSGIFRNNLLLRIKKKYFLIALPQRPSLLIAIKLCNINTTLATWIVHDI